MNNRNISQVESLNRRSWRGLSGQFFLSLFSLLLVTSMAFADDYSVNKSLSKVKWEAKKVTGKHDGTIAFENGSLQLSGNKISGGTFVIDMKSIVCNDITDEGTNKKLVGHLWSDDFFSVEKFGTSKLDIKRVEQKSGDTWKFSGDLTIKGITQPIEFDAKVNVASGKVMATGLITINRAKYDIKYGSGSFFNDLGDRLIYDDFTLDFVLVADKK